MQRRETRKKRDANHSPQREIGPKTDITEKINT